MLSLTRGQHEVRFLRLFQCGSINILPAQTPASAEQTDLGLASGAQTDLGLASAAQTDLGLASAEQQTDLGLASAEQTGGFLRLQELTGVAVVDDDLRGDLRRDGALPVVAHRLLQDALLRLRLPNTHKLQNAVLRPTKLTGTNSYEISRRRYADLHVHTPTSSRLM